MPLSVWPSLVTVCQRYLLHVYALIRNYRIIALSRLLPLRNGCTYKLQILCVDWSKNARIRLSVGRRRSRDILLNFGIFSISLPSLEQVKLETSKFSADWLSSVQTKRCKSESERAWPTLVTYFYSFYTHTTLMDGMATRTTSNAAHR